jgi:beta-glucosidase
MMKRVRGGLAAGVAAAVAVGVLLPGAALGEGRCGTYAWCDMSLSPDQRATLLENAMSQSDKIAMLTGGSASDVGVPAIAGVDGSVGVRTTGKSTGATAFPSATALAANFDPAMARMYGAAVADEVRAYGYDYVQGPNVNIMRTPLGGRTFEAYGEDPLLSGQMSIGWIDGAQSQGVMSTIKHYILNDQEGQLGVSPLFGADGGRVITNVVVNPRTLHEIDLRPFAEAIAQAHPAQVMCSYNQINGEFGCDNPYTLQTVLRKELGFQGIIQSDLFAAHTPQADLNAGMDYDIGGNSDNAAEVRLALADGQVSQQTLEARVHEYLRTLFAYGFFDRNAYVNDPTKIDQAHSDAVATATEEGGATLLKNDGVLPLTGMDRKIVVIGKPAELYIFGYGSSQVTPDQTPVTLLQGIQTRAAKAGDTVTYDDASNLSQAAADAKNADAAIVVAADSETEGSDKQCMSLMPSCAPTTFSTLGNYNPQDEQLAWGNQDKLVSTIEQANPHTIAVLESGAPVLTPWRASLGALLEAWYPGQDGGTAIADVLWGDVNPGGRLPVTFPDSYGQEPTASSTSCYPGTPGGTVQTSAGAGTLYTETVCEGVFPGYRWFDARHLKPAYPFGFGLSYTGFRLSHLAITPNAAAPGATVAVTVTNTGRRTGYAVPELYLGLPSSKSVPEPPAALAGFAKVQLAPGQSQTVTIPIDAQELSYWDTATSSWRIAPGCAKVMVGTSSQNLPLQGVLADGGADCRADAAERSGNESRRIGRLSYGR